MQDLYTVTINGTKLHVDAEDASFMERYQAAYDAMSANPADTLNDNPATVIRKYCQSYRNFFDALFGDGTAARTACWQQVRASRWWCTAVSELS